MMAGQPSKYAEALAPIISDARYRGLRHEVHTESDMVSVVIWEDSAFPRVVAFYALDGLRRPVRITAREIRIHKLGRQRAATVKMSVQHAASLVRRWGTPKQEAH